MQKHKQNKGIALPPTLLPLLDFRLSVPLHCFLHAEFYNQMVTSLDQIADNRTSQCSPEQ